MSRQIYTYTYKPVGHEKTYVTRVWVNERGIQDGALVYLLESVDGEWPHRKNPEGAKSLLRAMVMPPEDEHEWLNNDLVAVDGNGMS